MTNPTRLRSKNVLVRIKSGVRLRLRDVVAVIINRPINISPHSSFTADYIKMDFRNTKNRVHLVKVDNKMDSRLFCNLVSKSSVTGSSLHPELNDYLSLAHFGSVARESISVNSNLKLAYQFFNYQSKMLKSYKCVIQEIEEVFTIPLDDLRVPLGQFDRLIYQRLVVFIGAQSCAPRIVVDLEEVDALNDTSFLEILLSLLEQKCCIFVSRNEKLLDQLKDRFEIDSIEQFGSSGLEDESIADFTENPLDLENDLTVGFEEDVNESEIRDLPLTNFYPSNTGSEFFKNFSLEYVRINGLLTSIDIGAKQGYPICSVKKSDQVIAAFRVSLSEKPINSDLILVVRAGSASQLVMPIEFDLTKISTGSDVLIELEISLIDLNAETLGLGILLRDSSTLLTFGKMRKLMLLETRSSDRTQLTTQQIVKSVEIREINSWKDPT